MSEYFLKKIIAAFCLNVIMVSPLPGKCVVIRPAKVSSSLWPQHCCQTVTFYNSRIFSISVQIPQAFIVLQRRHVCVVMSNYGFVMMVSKCNASGQYFFICHGQPFLCSAVFSKVSFEESFLHSNDR